MKRDAKNRYKRIIEMGGFKPSLGYISDDGKHHLPRSSNTQQWLKRMSNKRVRKTPLPHKGNGYRKAFDYWYIWF